MGDRADRLARLQALKKAKNGKKHQASTDDVYDEVDEDAYASIVRGRLLEDDFIVDDDGSGYVDNGEEEDWSREYGSEGEEDESNKQRRRKDARGRPDPRKRLTTAFSKAASSSSTPKPPRPVRPAPVEVNPYKKTVNHVKEDDFMSNLLGDLASTGPASFMSASQGRKRKGSSPDYDAFRTSRTPLSASSDPSSDDLLPKHLSDLSSDGLDGEAPTDYKKPRLGVEHQLDDLGFGDVSYDFGAGGGDFDMDVDEPASAQQNSAVKQEPDDDMIYKPSGSNGPSKPPPRARTLVNARSNKPSALPKQDPLAPADEDSKPQLNTESKKPKGLDWRIAAANVALADANEDEPTPEDLASASTSVKPKVRGAKAVDGPAPTTKIDAFEKDGSLRFYWLDHVEVNGAVHLTGKVYDRAATDPNKRWVSCCVRVNGIMRNLFVLPRVAKSQEKRIAAQLQTSQPSKKEKKNKDALDSDDEEERESSDEESDSSDHSSEAEDSDEDPAESEFVPTVDDVEDDFQDIMSTAGITKWSSKEVVRKYAFELPGIPSEARYLKVVYGFDQPQLPMDLTGRTFSHVFGTNTSQFELFVVKRRIIGPCWLEIKDAQLVAKNASWCKLEVSVPSPKCVNPFKESDNNAPKEMPRLNILSLSVRTIVNHKENKREIVCASARKWENVDLDDVTPIEKQAARLQTFIRPTGMFPAGFEDLAKRSRSPVTPVKAERILLNQLLLYIYQADPDVIVGHEFSGVTLDVLLHRMRDLKADAWSRIGRFKRDRWPRLQGGRNSHILNGRMILDLASDGSKSMISSTTWSLTEMCSSHLKVDRVDIDPDDTADYFDSTAAKPDRLMDFVRHCEADSFFQMAIANKVQILPLTKQLTNLAGNSWNRTLSGGRAERNEYILLHEFHKNKFICPDKISRWDKKAASAAARAAQDENEEGEDGAAPAKKNSKKDKYKGGLVFEPKRGLWDKYVLVMDFNSLYPSIIQEYNIDFTTVDRKPTGDDDDLDKIPDVPSIEELGVLPRLIKTLVDRRKAVKGLMKDKNAGAAKQLQWDIKQKALKLTANSMYGCLGFEGSRFYARPLAALTTSKGREILTNTRQLAESMQLDVVYGDTDSIFVNTNVTELQDALAVGNEFKRLVNERYKLLEIDTDAVFQRILLLQKKKYAAIEVKGPQETSIEIKGLDMKRREYCALSKNVSGYVLKQILSGEPTEIVVENIHDYLASVGAGVRAGKVALDDFIIWKRLGKNPQDYPDAKSQPHVQVALRQKQRGIDARAGDVIPYIFCLGADGSSSRSAQADRAHHPDELRRADATLKIDFEHYLSLQVLPPVERLCDQIEGTDRTRLAECLGLDTARYQTAAPTEEVEREFHTLESQISDSDRFKEAERLHIRCRSCRTIFDFDGLNKDPENIVRSSGFVCPNPECCTVLNEASIGVQIDTQIRAFIAKFYEGWVVCDDQSCLNRTRQISVYGRRCLRPECRGTMHLEYSDKKLYNQILYFDHLFDLEHAQNKAAGTAQQDNIHALAIQNQRLFDTIRASVTGYLDRCGRRYVGMANFFSFMRLS